MMAVSFQKIKRNEGKSVLMPSTLLTCSLLLLVMAPTETKSFDFSSLLSTVAGNIVSNLYVNGDMKLLGHYCLYKRTPYFYKWELNYKAEVRCPGWTPIVGEAKNYKSPTGSERAATKDFVRQALEQGLTTEEEAQNWLS